MRRIISLILVFITALTFMACKAKDDDDIDIKGEPANDQSGSLIINEVLSSNKYWLELEEGFFPDFIELKNNSSSSVSISQYSLTDNQAEPSKYVFPERTLEPGGLFVVYCGGSENTGNRAVGAGDGGQAVHENAPHCGADRSDGDGRHKTGQRRVFRCRRASCGT